MTRPWTTLATEQTTDGPLELRRRGETDFIITIGGRILMTSAAHRSEDALARLSCAKLVDRKSARVLVSGLGMGFTLRAALAELGPKARVRVVERNAIVAGWCRELLAPLTDGALSDRRVALEIDDVMAAVARIARDSGAPRLDAIILDMYEGPSRVPRASDPLYGSAAVRLLKSALAPRGVLAVWGEAASPGFERSLRDAGFGFEMHREGRGARTHIVYVAVARSERRAVTGPTNGATATRPRPPEVGGGRRRPSRRT